MTLHTDVKLTDLYRDRFREAAQNIEPLWQEEKTGQGSYLWIRNNPPLTEQFEIKEIKEIKNTQAEFPVLIFSLMLPESYLQTTIYEEVRRCQSIYDLSIILLNRKLWLNSALSTSKLDDSIMDFIRQARSELTNILDCLIQVPNHNE